MPFSERFWCSVFRFPPFCRCVFIAHPQYLSAFFNDSVWDFLPTSGFYYSPTALVSPPPRSTPPCNSIIHAPAALYTKIASNVYLISPASLSLSVSVLSSIGLVVSILFFLPIYISFPLSLISLRTALGQSTGTLTYSSLFTISYPFSLTYPLIPILPTCQKARASRHPALSGCIPPIHPTLGIEAPSLTASAPLPTYHQQDTTTHPSLPTELGDWLATAHREQLWGEFSAPLRGLSRGRSALGCFSLCLLFCLFVIFCAGGFGFYQIFWRCFVFGSFGNGSARYYCGIYIYLW